jgi:hypothetical protein
MLPLYEDPCFTFSQQSLGDYLASPLALDRSAFVYFGESEAARQPTLRFMSPCLLSGLR